MSKRIMAISFVLISLFVVSFAGCDRIQRVLLEEPEPVPTRDTRMEPETVPNNEGIGIFDTSVMTGHGLGAEVYIPGGEILQLPDFEPLTPVRTFSVANVDVPARRYEEGFPELGIDALANFAIRLCGKLQVEAPGQYNFALSSDDGSKLSRARFQNPIL